MEKRMSTTRNPKPETRNSGFTLIELLVVIAVISILAMLTVSAAMQVRGRMRVRTARGSASRLAQAIEAYQAQMNFLPAHVLYNPETDGDADYENYEIIAQLNGIMNRDPLIKLEEEEKNVHGSFKDPWGRPFRVVMWKERVTDVYYKYFQVYSCGQDAKWGMGAGDDLEPKL
jgi:prepilin-type N-terminal cleavage/methylation domain-containing protein